MKPDGELRPGDVLSLDIALLDDNPFQMRTAMDAAKLTELAASIQQSGLLQPIAVRPNGPGRYTVVAGHRRVAAFKQLLAAATTDADRRTYSLIKAQVIAAVSDTQLAIACYAENAARDGLTPFEEAASLAKIRELGSFSTAAQVAAATGQPERRVRRLLKLFAAPTVVREAVDAGLMVDVAALGEPPCRERRRLELIAALEFARLHEHFTEKKPATADERTLNAMTRALSYNWGLRRIQSWVEAVLNNTARPTPPMPGAAGADPARSVPPKDKGTDEPAPARDVCSSTADHVTLYFARLKVASLQQLEAARQALDDARQLVEAQLQARAPKTVA